MRLTLPPFQTEKLSRESGLGGQGQADQIRRAIPGMDGDRGGGSDAGEKQQGRKQMHRGSLARQKRPSGRRWTMGRRE